MKAELIRIGNSQGIRIPRAVIDQCGFGQQVEMRVEGESLIITRARAVRSGWDEALKAMAEHGDDAALLPDDLEHSFDRTEWDW
jgi:antitoxin MazE